MQTQSQLPEKFVTIAFGLLLLAGCYVSSRDNYLLFHTLTEFFGIIVACGVFMVAWHARQFMENNYVLFIGIAYLFVAGFALIHTLAYIGRPIFPNDDANLPMQLWIVAQALTSLSLLLAPLTLGRKLRVKLVFASYTLMTVLALAAIFTGIFPACFRAGTGLTPFKQISEYLICAFLGAAVGLLQTRRHAFDARVLNLLCASIGMHLGSELLITEYASVHGMAHLSGHILAILSYYLMYQAIIKTGLEQPYRLLLRTLKQREASLQQAHDDLQRQVAEQARTNARLQQEITEHKRAEEALHAQQIELELQNEELRTGKLLLEASQQQYADLYDFAPVGYCTLDRDGRISEANLTAAMLFGVERARFINTRLEQYLLEADRDILFRHLRTLSHARTRQTCELRLSKPAGSPLYVQLETIGSEERPERYRTSISEITAQKQMEAALRESEDRYRQVFENISDALFLLEVTADGRFRNLDLNPAFEKAVGIPAAQLIGKYIDDTVPDETARSVIAKYRQCVDTGTTGEYEVELTLPVGRCWFRSTLVPVRDATGRIYRIVGMTRDITARKQAEQLLFQREQEFRALVENSPDTVVRYDRAGQRVYVNPAFEALTATPASELIGKTPVEAFMHTPTFGRQIHEAVTRVLRTGAPTEIEITRDTAAGTVKYIQIRYVPEFDVDDRVAGVLSVGRDITTLRETELSLSRLAEISPGMMGTYLLRPDGTVCMPYTSPRIRDIYGVQPEDVVQDASAANDRIYPDDLPGVIASIAESARTLTPWHHEFRLRHPERGEVWAEGHSTPRRQPDGSTIWYGFVHDITERKQTEEALLKSKEEWERTFDAVPDLIALIDPEYRIIRANRAMAENLGLTPARCAGLRCYVAVHGLEAPPAFCPHRQLLHDRHVHTVEVFEERLGGNFLVTVSPLFDAHASVFGSVHIARNINDRKRFEEQLQQTAAAAEAANRAKSEFLANMSHEIRTPMNAILGFAEILAGKITDAQQRQYVTLIRTSGKTLLGLINDILDLSKIEAGKLDLQYGAVNLRLACQEVAQIFSQTVSEKGLDFVLELDPELPAYLLFDEIRLRQILLNLVGNAVKFTETGKVSLRVYEFHELDEFNEFNELESSPTHKLCFEIEDTGIGIPADQRDGIFGVFEQVHGQSRKYGGTGLGLAITKRLAAMMGGAIAVTGEVGKGSTFTVQFPHIRSVAGSEMAASPAAIPFDALRFEQATILIADDVPDNRLLLRSYLEEFGFTMIEAANGEEAIALAMRAQPALILMDMRMPAINGYEAAQTLKHAEPTRAIPVIAVTGTALKESVATILAVCDGYISKPVEKAVLVAELVKFLPHTLAPEHLAPEAVAQHAGKGGFDLAALTPEMVQRLPEARQLLETVWLPRWQEFRAALIMDDVKHFAAELAQFARQYQLQFLLDYAERLLQHAQSYDVSGVKKRLTEFPGLVKRLTCLSS